MRSALARSGLDTVEIPRPLLDDLPYRDLVRRILTAQGFKLEFNRLEPDQAIALVCDQLLGRGTFVRERALLADDIAILAQLVGGLLQTRATVAVRTFFAPGDLVWHVDRFAERAAFRMVWPIARPAGMRVTTRDNIDLPMYRAFMRREYPLLCQMDSEVAQTGAPVERIWGHRPAQLDAMIRGQFPFVRNPELEWEITPGAASIHRVETVPSPGTFHRSSWANRQSPGFQIVITVASDAG